MLELLDLRERGGRLEPSKLEIDPATTETAREMVCRFGMSAKLGPVTMGRRTTAAPSHPGRTWCPM